MLPATDAVMACHRGVALITGGCGGLGLAFAKRWLEVGGKRVRLVDMVSASAGAAAAGTFEAAYGRGSAEFVSCDVTDAAQLRAAFDVDGLGLVLNNAGVVNYSPDTFDRWDAQVAVNLGGVIDGTRLALEAFGKQRGPNGFADGESRVVVNVGSMAGLIATPSMAVYTATKFGVVGFSRAMHVEARRQGVRVHALCPSFTDTGMVNEDVMAKDPLSKKTVAMFGGLMTPEHVTDALFDRVVDEPNAEAVLRITPLEGVAFDDPSPHPAEVAIRNAFIKSNPLKFLKRALLPRKKRPD